MPNFESVSQRVPIRPPEFVQLFGWIYHFFLLDSIRGYTVCSPTDLDVSIMIAGYEWINAAGNSLFPHRNWTRTQEKFSVHNPVRIAVLVY